MNSDHNQELELAISRELKSLPEMVAPASVVSKVMAAIERRASLPWYRRSWARLAGRFANWRHSQLMLLMFGGLCLAGWEMARTETVVRSAHGPANGFPASTRIGTTFDILAGSAVLVVKEAGRDIYRRGPGHRRAGIRDVSWFGNRRISGWPLPNVDNSFMKITKQSCRLFASSFAACCWRSR